MQHIYTPEEYSEIKRLQQELLKDNEIDTTEFPKRKPNAQTVKNILAYSRALEVKKIPGYQNFEQILN